MELLKTVWPHIRRSPYQSLAAVLIVVMTFFIGSLFIILGIGGSRVINYFESKPQITAFFREEATPEQIKSLESSLKETDKVASLHFVSKEDALKIYQQKNKDDPLLLDLVTASILPSSLEVSAVSVKDLDELAKVLKTKDFISEVVFQKDIVDTLISWTNAVRGIGLALFASLSVISVLIIITVVGMKISLRRKEIEIMRLVGASSWYIRWPFIIEGALYGVVGAFVAWLFSYGLVFYAATFLKDFLFGVPIFPFSPFLMLSILGLEILAAIILGAFASFLAVLRYLK